MLQRSEDSSCETDSMRTYRTDQVGHCCRMPSRILSMCLHRVGSLRLAAGSFRRVRCCVDGSNTEEHVLSNTPRPRFSKRSRPLDSPNLPKFVSAAHQAEVASLKARSSVLEQEWGRGGVGGRRGGRRGGRGLFRAIVHDEVGES